MDWYVPMADCRVCQWFTIGFVTVVRVCGLAHERKMDWYVPITDCHTYQSCLKAQESDAQVTRLNVCVVSVLGQRT